MCEETHGEEKMFIPSGTVLLDSCTLPDMGSRSKIYVLCKKQVLLTDEACLPPLLSFLNRILDRKLFNSLISTDLSHS